MITSLDNGSTILVYPFLRLFLFRFSIRDEKKKKGMTNCLEKTWSKKERNVHLYVLQYLLVKKKKKGLNFLNRKVFTTILQIFLPIIVRHNEIINKSSVEYLNQLRKLLKNILYYDECFFFFPTLNKLVTRIKRVYFQIIHGPNSRIVKRLPVTILDNPRVDDFAILFVTVVKVVACPKCVRAVIVEIMNNHDIEWTLRVKYARPTFLFDRILQIYTELRDCRRSPLNEPRFKSPPFHPRN